MPFEYMDIFRTTYTDLETTNEKIIQDYWTSDTEEGKKLSTYWKGSTKFQVMRPEPRPYHKWVNGLEVRIQKTSRPDNCDQHAWKKMTDPDKEEAKERWKIEGPIMEAERVKTGKRHLDPTKLEILKTTLAECQNKFPRPVVPAMLTITYDDKTIDAMAGYFSDNRVEDPPIKEQTKDEFIMSDLDYD